MAELTPREHMESMPDLFLPQNARGVNAVIQFKLSGEGGGNWYATFKNGTCTVTEGTTDAARATIEMDAQDYLDLATGKLGEMKSFMTGRVKASGDISLLRKMQRWFPKR